MRATRNIVAVGVVGLSLTACGTTGAAGSSTSTTAAPLSTTTRSVPPGTPVGFNAARAEFVLPHNLGLLPAPELALAKADSAYAAGLVNASDWTQIQIHLPSKNPSAPKVAMLWGYVGATSAASSQMAVTGTKANALSWDGMMAGIDGAGAIKVLNSTRVALSASTLNPLFTASSQFSSNAVPNGDQLLAPSMLEVLAAPVGNVEVGGTSLPAFCVPVPEAFVSGGKVTSPTSLPAMTAGPSTVFAGSLATAGSTPRGVLLYDQGVGSCASFH